MTETDKVKQLLTNPEECNQRLGVNLALSVLNWGYEDIAEFVIDNKSPSGRCFLLIFCGMDIQYIISEYEEDIHYTPFPRIQGFVSYKLLTDTALNEVILELKQGLANELKLLHDREG
jgi:hypothetical protein